MYDSQFLPLLSSFVHRITGSLKAVVSSSSTALLVAGRKLDQVSTLLVKLISQDISRILRGLMIITRTAFAGFFIVQKFWRRRVSIKPASNHFRRCPPNLEHPGDRDNISNRQVLEEIGDNSIVDLLCSGFTDARIGQKRNLAIDYDTVLDFKIIRV
jgi:hypothetical protein